MSAFAPKAPAAAPRFPAPSLPPQVVEALEAIRRASDGLIEAARAERPDPETIDGAVRDRAAAVEDLRRALDEARGAISDEARTELRSAATGIEEQAREAEAALLHMLEGARRALEALARGATAARGYAKTAQDPALDRTG